MYHPARLPNNWFPGCTCDLVQTGACVEEDRDGRGAVPYCAVSADACSSGTTSTYVLARELAANGLGKLDCRLCRDRQDFVQPVASNKTEFSTSGDENFTSPAPEEMDDFQIPRPEPPPVSVPLTTKDVSSPSFPEPLSDSSIESLFEEFEEEPQTAFLLVASIVGAGLAAFLLIVGFVLVCKRLNKKTNDQSAINPTFEELQVIGEDSGEGSPSFEIT